MQCAQSTKDRPEPELLSTWELVPQALRPLLSWSGLHSVPDECRSPRASPPRVLLHAGCRLTLLHAAQLNSLLRREAGGSQGTQASQSPICAPELPDPDLQLDGKDFKITDPNSISQ